MELTGPEFCTLMRKVIDKFETKLQAEDIENTTDLGYFMEALEFELEEHLKNEQKD